MCKQGYNELNETIWGNIYSLYMCKPGYNDLNEINWGNTAFTLNKAIMNSIEPSGEMQCLHA